MFKGFQKIEISHPELPKSRAQDLVKYAQVSKITLRDRALRVMAQRVPTTQHMRQHGKFDNFRCPGAPETHF